MLLSRCGKGNRNRGTGWNRRLQTPEDGSRGPVDSLRFGRELEVLGVASRERVGRLIEGITLLRRFWSEDG